MKMKHTPGPWVFDREFVEVKAPKGCVVRAAYRSHIPFEQTKANMALIAAAPELLALLQEYVAFNGEYAGSMPEEDWVERVQAAVRAHLQEN